MYDAAHFDFLDVFLGDCFLHKSIRCSSIEPFARSQNTVYHTVRTVRPWDPFLECLKALLSLQWTYAYHFSFGKFSTTLVNQSCIFQTIPGLQFWSIFVRIRVYTHPLVFDIPTPCQTNLRHIEKYFWNLLWIMNYGSPIRTYGCWTWMVLSQKCFHLSIL